MLRFVDSTQIVERSAEKLEPIHIYIPIFGQLEVQQVEVSSQSFLDRVSSIRSHSADGETTKGRLAFSVRPAGAEAEVEFTLARLGVAAIIEIRR